MPQIEIPIDKLAGNPLRNYGILEQYYVDAAIGVDYEEPTRNYPGHFEVWLKSLDSVPDFLDNGSALEQCIEEWLQENEEWIQEELAYQQSKRG